MTLTLSGIALSLTVLIAQATAPPVQRHLVYTFTYGVSTDRQVHTSGMGAGGNGDASGTAASGMADFTGGNEDKGTIAVDVVREQPDTGLVVSVSEAARDSRSAEPATCVVYSDTTIVCDPNKKINAEELTLLRFLGVHFVDPNQLDAKQHWHVERAGAISSAADYTIDKNVDGALTISEVRVVKEIGARARTTNVNATVGYDFNKTVPIAINAYSIERSEQGEQYNTIKTQTVLTLQTDSMAAVTKN